MVVYEPIPGMDAILARITPGKVSYGIVEAQANARMNQLFLHRTAVQAAMRADGVPSQHQQALRQQLQDRDQELKASSCMARTIDKAKAAAPAAAKQNTVATYPSHASAADDRAQALAHGDTGPASKPGPDVNKKKVDQ